MAPLFGPEISDECMERLIEFVLHYEFDLKKCRMTAHRKSQIALVRRMLLDLGIDTWAVYGTEGD
jgi:hypothetical protein